MHRPQMWPILNWYNCAFSLSVQPSTICKQMYSQRHMSTQFWRLVTELKNGYHDFIMIPRYKFTHFRKRSNLWKLFHTRLLAHYRHLVHGKLIVLPIRQKFPLWSISCSNSSSRLFHRFVFGMVFKELQKFCHNFANDWTEKSST